MSLVMQRSQGQVINGKTEVNTSLNYGVVIYYRKKSHHENTGFYSKHRSNLSLLDHQLRKIPQGTACYRAAKGLFFKRLATIQVPL